MAIDKVAVIGAGLMGGGIAAHVANAGVDVILLDIVQEGAKKRSELALKAVEGMLKTEPAPFMEKRNAKRIMCGNIEDDLGLLAEADWIVEAVIEKRDIKQAIFRQIDSVRKAGSIVSSNTSTIPCRNLMDGMEESFQRDFLITHFFNPPRYMRLLEIVSGEKTRDDAVAAVSDFADRRLGKGVVDCKDTPGFIANRIGTFWIQAAVVEAFEGSVTVEEADAAIGRALGIPKTGIFGLMDLVGIDLMPLVSKSLYDAVPENDAYRTLYGEPELILNMIKEGSIGRKGKGGFYRLNKESGKPVKEVIDLATGNYSTALRPTPDSVRAAGSSPRALFEHGDAVSAFAWQVMSATLAYAADLIPELADNVLTVDEAMKLGYAWKMGPFELVDCVGAGWFAERMAEEGRDVPALITLAAEKGGFYRVGQGRLQYLASDGQYVTVERAPGVLLLSDVKRAGKPILKNSSASLWDIGDGVACLEFHSKMNTIDPDILGMIAKSAETVGKGYKALVLHNEGSNFSVGVNLGLALFAINLAAWPMMEDMVKQGQDALKALKFAPFPVVGAPSGMALGGGCESLLHCDAVQAHAESYIGLVEVGVGLIPGWGGCKEMLVRGLADKKGGILSGGAMPVISRLFQTIGLAKVSRSAAQAFEYGYLRDGDRISANRDRLLADAKARALELAEDYQPPEPQEIKLPGKSARVALMMAVRGLAKTRKATPHDLTVVDQLGIVLTGGKTDSTDAVSEDHLSALERQALTTLARNPLTIARMEHMLDTGKPLRN
ncbi:MAG: 3-hydroxyacyl-CoA dehydrogenase NAD-binding domain-containing protein [Pseudomonadota bacterium]|nr:3-hydroxyacyl-CoA dehydrogenase NAD-binding domain-containing protein [Pseudomonadota bacterium]